MKMHTPRQLSMGLAAVFVVGLSGLAATSVLASSSSPGPGSLERSGIEKSSQGKTQATNGGPIERFHDTGPCDLTDVSSLPGNWTHGDYVSAVATGGDAALIPQAARSDCGKPTVAVDHGGGPPASALANMAAGRAHGQERSNAAQQAGPPGS
jgi:hypothetical protein